MLPLKKGASMTGRIPLKLLLIAIAAVGISASPALTHAQAIVTPTVTQLNTGVYHYDYSITNTTADDLFDVDIQVLPGPGVIFNVGAPTGFTTLYDYGLGLVSYTEDTGVFSMNTAVSGFVYDSLLAPKTSTFIANRTPASGGIIATNGSTPSAVPEPGSLTLICAISAVSLCALRRKRRSTSK